MAGAKERKKGARDGRLNDRFSLRCYGRLPVGNGQAVVGFSAVRAPTDGAGAGVAAGAAGAAAAGLAAAFLGADFFFAADFFLAAGTFAGAGVLAALPTFFLPDFLAAFFWRPSWRTS